MPSFGFNISEKCHVCRLGVKEVKAFNEVIMIDLFLFRHARRFTDSQPAEEPGFFGNNV